MATRSKNGAARDTSQSIALKTEAFLNAGGKIQHIEAGVTGKTNMSPNRNIKIGGTPGK